MKKSSRKVKTQGRRKKGLFIVFEGLDGSGKSTQSNLLVKSLRRLGRDVEKVDFPQYGTKSAGLIEEYLNGKYGTADEVGPYRASIFFASDRYAASFQIRKWLDAGKIVVSDRYIASNIGHQGGKIASSQERRKFIRWLFNLEYEIFGIPHPDITVILKTSPRLSRSMSSNISNKTKKAKRTSYLGNKKQDIHERDIRHLEGALDAYLFAAREFPKEFHVVECVEGSRLLSISEVQEKIQGVLKSLL